MNNGFTMIETVFSLLLFSLVAVALIQSIVLIKRGINQANDTYQSKVEEIEVRLNDLFIPVEDIEWAISQVLP